MDFFPPQDVMNKVIAEFLSCQQPHPELMADVVFRVRMSVDFLSCYRILKFKARHL